MSDQSLSMDGTNPESAINSEEQAARSARDRQRLRAVGFQHLQFAVGGLLVWGASGYWFSTSPGLLITILSLAGGYVIGSMLGGIGHEWGHYTGARLSGSLAPVSKERQGFFFFNFKMEENSRAQFLAMSVGGPTANWLMVLIALVALPTDNAFAFAALVATLTGIAINVCVFEFPVIYDVSNGADPRATIDQRLVDVSKTPCTSMRACYLAGYWVRCCWSFYRRVRALLPDRLGRVYLLDRHLTERLSDCVVQLASFRISPKYLPRW